MNRKKTEVAIVDAAIRVLAANPGASLGEIADQAGVGRATLHRYFQTRDDLVRSIKTRAIEETNQATVNALEGRTDPVERFRVMLEAVVPLGDRFHFIMSEPASAPGSEPAAQYAAELAWVADLVEELKKAGAVEAAVPTKWVVATIDALIWRAWKEVRDGHVARRDAPGLVYRTVLRGLQPDRERRPF